MLPNLPYKPSTQIDLPTQYAWDSTLPTINQTRQAAINSIQANFAALNAGSAPLGYVKVGGDTMTGPLATTIVKVGDGVVGAPSLTFIAEPTTGMYRVGAGAIGITLAGALVHVFGPTYFAVAPATTFAWYAPGFASLDTGISRNAAGVVEVNSGAVGAFRDLKLRTLLPNQIQGSAYAVTPTSGAIAIDWINGMTQAINVQGAITLSFSNFATYGPLLRLYFYNTQLGAVTWPAGVIWPGGTVPNLAAGPTKQALVALLTWGGATIMANVAVY